MRNLQGELLVMKTMGIRPNFTELGRTYNMDYRTIKKMYEVKPRKNEKEKHIDLVINTAGVLNIRKLEDRKIEDSAKKVRISGPTTAVFLTKSSYSRSKCLCLFFKYNYDIII